MLKTSILIGIFGKVKLQLWGLVELAYYILKQQGDSLAGVWGLG